jgi:Uma2 family endonuclease
MIYCALGRAAAKVGLSGRPLGGIMTRAVTTTQRAIVVGDISWSTYESFLADLRDQSAPRLFYDSGVLQIMSPSREHERYNRALALLVITAAEEMGIEVLDVGSTTYKREDLLGGIEPDSSFTSATSARSPASLHLT